jgi:hypothetical protein
VAAANAYVKNTEVRGVCAAVGRRHVQVCPPEDIEPALPPLNAHRPLHTYIPTPRARRHPATHAHQKHQVDSITIPVGPRLGDKVVEAKGLSKAFGDRLLVDNLDFSVPAGE